MVMWYTERGENQMMIFGEVDDTAIDSSITGHGFLLTYCYGKPNATRTIEWTNKKLK